MLSISLLGLSATALQARDLTPQEQSVCRSLKTCMDIASRHTASEFDYDVLGLEFRRFGLKGRQALFSLLESEDGHADVATLISKQGPLTPVERQTVAKIWTPERAQIYLPLFFDGHPMSRDLLLQSLGHPNADVREQVRSALNRLPNEARRAPISPSVGPVLLPALQKDPIREAAPYLNRLNAAGHERDFIALLGSGDRDIVTAAYNALYRNSPSKAFNGLLAEMGRIETAAQARAIGQMLALRHKARADGFYHKFASEMSGDLKLPVLARASGLHAVLTIADRPFPDLTPARLAALSALVEGQPFVVQDQYLAYLQKAKAQAALSHIWKVAQSENWINRDRIAEFYKTHSAYDGIISTLIRSNDIRTFSAGLREAKPSHRKLIQHQIDHPVNPIALAARNYLKLPAATARNQTCPIGLFDLEDMRVQMPFFESGWMVSDSKARVSLPRAQLTTAHPTATGWLAGYNLSTPKVRSAQSGGTLLHYENKSGAFKTIGDFSGLLAILPGRTLKLGETTKSFWIVDLWGPDARNVSAYRLDLSGDGPQINHIGAIPNSAQGFAVYPNGDLIIVFDDKNQLPIKLSKTGAMSLYCSNRPSGIAPRAPG